MLRTKSGLPKHCSWNVDRHGKRRVRFRWRGFSTYLAGTPWSEHFMRQYAAALDGVKVQATNVGAGRTIPGSFDALCVSYYRAPEFRGLKASTQKVRRNIIERFRAEHGRKPINRLGRAHIKDIIGAKADTPEAANNLLKVLRLLLAYALDQGMIDTNPAVGLRGYKAGRGLPHVDRDRGGAVPGHASGGHDSAARVRARTLHRAARQRRRAHGLAARQGRAHCRAPAKN